jgi:hypothetical protein
VLLLLLLLLLLLALPFSCPFGEQAGRALLGFAGALVSWSVENPRIVEDPKAQGKGKGKGRNKGKASPSEMYQQYGTGALDMMI